MSADSQPQMTPNPNFQTTPGTPPVQSQWQQTPPPQQGGGSKAWLWAGLGCGCGCLLLALLFFGSTLGLVLFGFSLIHQSDAVQLPLKVAEQNAEVQDELGTPLELGYLFQGNIDFDNDSGNANFTIPVKGPTGTGELKVKAETVNGDWVFERAEIRLNRSSKRIDLLPALQAQLEGGDTGGTDPPHDLEPVADSEAE